MKIYLASPWFNETENYWYEKIIKKMRSEGLEVYVPKEHEIRDAWNKINEVWAREVFFQDIQAIQECDEVWVLNFGMYSDSGTAWECGYAYGLGKTVRQLVYQGKKTFSLMMINGCDEFDTMSNYVNNREDEVVIEQK